MKGYESIVAGPMALNMFDTEAEAVAAAKAWSADQHFMGEWSVIHGPSEKGLTFFVEKGDGGMIRSTERLVGTYKNGKKLRN